MKKKIVGIFVCTLLICTIFSVSGQVCVEKNVENIGKTSFGDDVPNWKKGEKWIYNLDDIDFGDITSGLLHLQIKDLSFTVLGNSGTSYNLQTEANIGGYFEVDQEYYIKGVFINTKMNGVTYFRKTDLGLEEIDLTITGRLGLTIRISDLPFSIPNIPFGFTIDINLDFDSPFSLFDFPLNIGKIWGQPATNLTVNGEMRSLWFNIINFLNNIFHFLPDEIADLLPVIDIKEALEMFVEDNIIEFPDIPELFNCSNMEIRTVPAGSYEAYHITVGKSGSIYYAPEVGNIIEISVGNFKMELKKLTINIKPS